MTMIAQNLQQVREQIQRACEVAGRLPSGVNLLAVSKTWGCDAVLQALLAGQSAFGENYIQEAVEKIVAVRVAADTKGLNSQNLRWYCIGPVQSNKTRLVAQYFDGVHTVDRIKIAQRLSDQRPHHLRPLEVCLQINVDGGSTKAGVAPSEVLALALDVVNLPRLRLRGLMSMPDALASFEAQRAVHLLAKRCFDDVRAGLSTVINQEGLAAHMQFDTLSMGMSADLEAAISAGSTMVRVGTGIFGVRSNLALEPV
jgi:pyridoxal phosphate enzyme (YggS family)